jgi:hypothetical protein
MIVVAPHRFGSARWWRVRFLSTNSGDAMGTGNANYVDIRFIAMLDGGGTNLVPLNLGIQTSPGIGAVANVLVDDGSISNNQGIQQVAIGMWYAFKLPTMEKINTVQVRNYGTGGYSPGTIVVESSLDGLTWAFEWGETMLGWGGQELKTFVRPNIDWGSYTSQDWMVRTFQTVGNANLGILEMEMASTIGGTDLCVGGTPRSTGNSTYPASNLTDNSVDSLCGASGDHRNAYVGYSFPNPVKVDEVRFASHSNEQALSAALCVGAGTPGTFSGPWYIKQLVDGVPPLGWAQWHSLDFRRSKPTGATGPHRYWRARATSPSTGNEMTLFSCSAADWQDGTGLSLTGANGTPIGGGQYDGNNAITMAYDGNGATNWASPYTGQYSNQWIGYDFGAPVFPRTFTMRSTEESGYWNRTMRYFNIEWSDDGISWYAHRGYQSNYTAQGQTLTFPL